MGGDGRRGHREKGIKIYLKYYTMNQGGAHQLWNVRQETRTLNTKLAEIKSRLIEQMGVGNLPMINSKLSNLS
jgi:predicted transcriptional regulator